MKLIFGLSCVFVVIIIMYLYVPFGSRQKEEAQISQIKSMNEDKKITIDVLSEGSGVVAKTGDQVSVDYTGELQNGTVFDSSIPRGEPFNFTLGRGQVIKGWEQGILGMKVGETRKLTIPSDLAYGEEGFSTVIPPRATLIFTVKLLGIK